MTREPRKYLGQTVQVKEGHQLDARRLETFLRDTITGFEGPLEIKQFESGQSNLTYLITTPKRAYVLRRKPPGKLLKSAHAVDREFRVMRKLGELGFPVPETVLLCEDDSVVGTMFYVMGHVPGRVFLDCSMPDLSRTERAAVFDSVNAVLARLHSIDYVTIGLEDFGRPGNYFTRQIARWAQQYEASKSEEIAEMDKLITWLPGAVPGDDIARLIHGDYSFHNVLIHPTESRVAAVIDWELSTIGHPLGDLMYHMMEWYRPAGGDLRGTLQGRDLEALGIPEFEQYLQRYCERAGLPRPANVAFYRAYNLFRMAAIKQGIAGRVRDGTGVAQNAAEIGADVRPLAQAAWREAQAAGAT
jgi:aminoglycoside phosphotransferase (APT) family kinase protein